MLTTIGSLPIIQALTFLDEPWLVHGFGLRDITVEKYLEAFRLRDISIPNTHQVHGARVHILSTKDKSSYSPSSIVHSPPLSSPPLLEGDAFLTDQPNLLCPVRTADCLPILLADTKHHVIGAIHSGWRGTADKIVLEVFKTMSAEWGTKPQDLKVALGPAIGGHCYPVGADVTAVFKKAGLFPAPWAEALTKDKWFLDIAFANFFMLEQAGVPRERIYLSLACTACDLAKFASYRREGKKRGEQVNWILKK